MSGFRELRSRSGETRGAVAACCPSWPTVVRILVKQRLMPLSDSLSSLLGSTLILLAQFAFLSGIDSSGQSLRYIVLTSVLAPPHPIGLLAARSSSGALASFALTLPALLLAAGMFQVHVGLRVSWLRLALFVASLAFAWCVSTGLSLITAYLGIALKQDEAAVQLKVFISQLGSGALIPTYLYPQWLQRVLSLLPFVHMADTPVAMASGASIGRIGVQILWAVGLLGAGTALWMKRIGRLDIYGG